MFVALQCADNREVHQEEFVTMMTTKISFRY